MDLYDLTLSCGPPLLAMALQRWSIPSDRTLEKLAIDEQQRIQLPPASAKLIEYNLKGIVAEGGLVTTVVSFPTGAFALASSTHSGALFTYILMFIGISVIIAGLWLVGGKSPHDVAVKRFPFEEERWPAFVMHLPCLFQAFVRREHRHRSRQDRQDTRAIVTHARTGETHDR